ncbi:hypothetical protein G6F64_014753 [Rhizopus arrhizus]|uniref:Uncharacterized protein n=1 Tax=Rhizopus oryzae TaxID=64495 RepID=A0A9P6WTF6_RHIOR|nr:hypothetical protein G6F64_014753 [Rhizopus arrhizus]
MIVGADRPPGAIHAAHQRCALGGHPPARPGRAALPAGQHPQRHPRPTPGAHPVPALQAAAQPWRRRLGGAG